MQDFCSQIKDVSELNAEKSDEDTKTTSSFGIQIDDFKQNYQYYRSQIKNIIVFFYSPANKEDRAVGTPTRLSHLYHRMPPQKEPFE